jgi:Fe-S oxidoreductase
MLGRQQQQPQQQQEGMNEREKILNSKYVKRDMGAAGEYYNAELSRVVGDHGYCKNCQQAFETNNQTDLKYPFRSYVCRCTLCRECINSCGAQITPGKIHTFDCPLCLHEKAWNLRKLLPDLQFVNLLHAVTEIQPYSGIDKKGDGSAGGEDGHEDDHSNGEADDGTGGKRKWRHE